MASMTVVGLNSSALQARKSFSGARVSSARTSRAAVRVAATKTVAKAGEYPSNWLPKNGTVLVAGFLGWTFPSTIPVSAFGGQSLFGKFTAEIGEHLAQFPQGPPLNDEFWLLMITWHIGLFLTLTLGQIGVQGRRQGYW